MIPLFNDLPDDLRDVVDVLHSVAGWPIDFGKDAEFVNRMIKLYPKVNLFEEAVRFAAWMSEHKQAKTIKYRARFSTWMKKANGTRTRSNRGYRPAEKDGHGDSVQARRDW